MEPGSVPAGCDTHAQGVASGQPCPGYFWRITGWPSPAWKAQPGSCPGLCVLCSLGHCLPLLGSPEISLTERNQRGPLRICFWLSASSERPAWPIRCTSCCLYTFAIKLCWNCNHDDDNNRSLSFSSLAAQAHAKPALGDEGEES